MKRRCLTQTCLKWILLTCELRIETGLEVDHRSKDFVKLKRFFGFSSIVFLEGKLISGASCDGHMFVVNILAFSLTILLHK